MGMEGEQWEMTKDLIWHYKTDDDNDEWVGG